MSGIYRMKGFLVFTPFSEKKYRRLYKLAMSSYQAQEILHSSRCCPFGFTLAEMLIAVSVLGVIATFTIPKVLQAQTDAKYAAIGKETFSMIAEAYARYQQQHAISSATGPKDLTPYMNYVRVDTTSTIDHLPGYASLSCNSQGRHCLQLHNGAILRITEFNHFCSTDSDQYIFFVLDPDGKYSGSLDGPGKALQIQLYTNGRMNTMANIQGTDNTCLTNTPQNYGTEPDPDWFTW